MRVACLLVLLTLPSPLLGQLVRGRVVDTAGVPLAHALVQLREDASEFRTQVVTTSSGRFALAGPRPSDYVLRVVAIGYTPRTTAPMALASGSTELGDLVLRRAVVELAEIRVDANAACGARSGGGEVLASLLDASRSALEVMEAVMDDPRGRLRIRQVLVRIVSARPAPLVTADTSEARSVRWPILSLSADSAAEFGFVVRDEPTGGDTWYGPDAKVLFSDWFLSSHCFRVAVDGTGEGPITVHFEPVARRRGITDVVGTLELDPTSLALRRMTFNHVNLPYRLPDAASGGEIRFAETPSGTWLPIAWRLFAPAGRAAGRVSESIELHGAVINDPPE
jgi:hypothetical protein